MRGATIAIVLAGVMGAAAPAAAAQGAARGQSSPPVVKVCGLLPATEVKKLIGGGRTFDMFSPEEEALGTYGSSCNYAGVMVQVLPFSQATIDAARKRGRLDPVSGVGDEAYLFDNRGEYAELYVRVGRRLLTLQRDVPTGKTVADVRAGTVALAQALAAKLR